MFSLVFKCWIGKLFVVIFERFDYSSSCKWNNTDSAKIEALGLLVNNTISYKNGMFC